MITGVIFDLDGVIVTTDDNHYKAWKRMADEEKIPFDRAVNEHLRGVSRMESLKIILKNTVQIFSAAQKEEMCARKNRYYCESLNALSPADVLPGVNDLLRGLKEKGIATAIGSSSKNTALILERIGMTDTFDVVADGSMIVNSKPDPEVFLLAAKLLKKAPDELVVIEDAAAGIEAAMAAGMRVVGVGAACEDKRAHYRIHDLSGADVNMILGN